MTLSPKIEPRHQRLQAIVYIRQSTPKQVQNNQESTRRQYQLAERARQMGWAASQIRQGQRMKDLGPIYRTPKPI